MRLRDDCGLARFNANWLSRRELFLRSSPFRWATGHIITPALRSAFQTFLPVEEFLSDLQRLARKALPDPSWIPRILRTSQVHTARRSASHAPPSLPELWAMLPPQLAGRVSFTPDQFTQLLCAFADPPQFGTDLARYPDQAAQLCRHVVDWDSGRSIAVLDLGCGTGQGTRETAFLFAECGVRNPRAVGITAEPIEVWMATHRRLPHRPEREAALRALPPQSDVYFVCGDALAPPLCDTFDIVLCNGLVGGRFLQKKPAFHTLLTQCRSLLAPNGVLALANSFHDGALVHLQLFATVAKENSWTVEGTPRDLWLQPAIR